MPQLGQSDPRITLFGRIVLRREANKGGKWRGAEKSKLHAEKPRMRHPVLSDYGPVCVSIYDALIRHALQVPGIVGK